MKNIFWISALMLFVVYATRIDVSLKKIFSTDIAAQYSDINQAENETSEKEKEECEDDDAKNDSFLHGKLTIVTRFQSNKKIVATRHKVAFPSYDIESPPPKA